MAKGRAVTPVSSSNSTVSDFELQLRAEQSHDDGDKVYRGRTPSETTPPTSSLGIGFHHGLQYGGGDVLFARTTSYESLDKYFREYKRDSLVRQSIHVRAEWVTKDGFETDLAPIDPADGDVNRYGDVKVFVDNVNRVVNFDAVHWSASRFLDIAGIAAYLIVRDTAGVPVRLLELEPWNLTPDIDEATGGISQWEYTGTKIQVEDKEKGEGRLRPEQLLFFTNSEFLNEYVGLSEIEPILKALQARRFLIEEALQETAKSLWAPAGLLQVDTGRSQEADALVKVRKVVDKTALAPGKFVGINKDVTFQKVDITPRIDLLVAGKKDLDNEIIGNFQVPHYLLNRSANAGLSIGSTEAEVSSLMFIAGPIASRQRQLRRQIEARWYEPLIRLNLKLKPEALVPVRLKHLWNPVSVPRLSKPTAPPIPPGIGLTDESVIRDPLARDDAEFRKASIEEKQAKRRLWEAMMLDLTEAR